MNPTTHFDLNKHAFAAAEEMSEESNDLFTIDQARSAAFTSSAFDRADYVLWRGMYDNYLAQIRAWKKTKAPSAVIAEQKAAAQPPK